MSDFNVRSDAVNVEQIMEQIRARIREKRGVDYTEAQVRELASVKLEKFLDPRGVRSDLLEQYRKTQAPYAPPELPNFSFEADTLFASTRGPLRLIRRLLLPILKLFFNPNPLIQALNIQSRLNASAAEREAKRDAQRYAFDQLHYEVMHNLVIETTRLGIEMKNLKMRMESLASRLEFNERRARALESVVVYKPAEEEQRASGPRPSERRPSDARSSEGRSSSEQRRDDGRRQSAPQNGVAAQGGGPRHGDAAGRRPAPPQSTPQPGADAGQSSVAAAATSSEADVNEAGAASATGLPEGPGQRSRRRRRRRGRRGSGASAAALAAGEGATDASAADADGELEADAAGADNGDGEPGGDIAAAVDAGIDAGRGAGVPFATDDERTQSSSAGPASPSPYGERRSGTEEDGRAAGPEPLVHAFGARTHPAEPAVSDPVHDAPAPGTPTPASEPPAAAASDRTSEPAADHEPPSTTEQ
jgi:hypothetical protein